MRVDYGEGSGLPSESASAMYLLQSGQWMIDVLMEPVLTQIRLRNIFEVTFATMERKTQAERYHIMKGR